MVYQMDDDEYFIAENHNPQPLPKFLPIPWEQVSVFDPVPWLIKGILPRAELAVIYGRPGSGKTFCVLDMAMSIARGIEWEGKRVKKGRVVYICAESLSGFRHRLKAYEIHNKITGQSLPFDVIANAPNFLNTMDAAIIGPLIGKADCIVVDTFSRTMPGGNENGAEHVGMAISQCQILSKSTGALVFLVHHCGKDSEKGARGWSGLNGAADTEIEITKIGDRRKGRITKQKDGADDFEWGFKLEVVDLGTDEDGDMVTSCVYAPLNCVPMSEQTKTDKPLGKVEKLVLDAFMLFGVYSVDIEEVIEEAKKAIAYDPQKEDRRRDHIIRAINSLKTKGLVDLVDNHVCKP